MLIATVDDNKNKLSAQNFSRVKIARALQHRIGRQMTKDFIRYVTAKLIPNCSLTLNEIKNTEFAWGPDLGSLKR